MPQDCSNESITSDDIPDFLLPYTHKRNQDNDTKSIGIFSYTSTTTEESLQISNSKSDERCDTFDVEHTSGSSSESSGILWTDPTAPRQQQKTTLRDSMSTNSTESSTIPVTMSTNSPKSSTIPVTATTTRNSTQHHKDDYTVTFLSGSLGMMLESAVQSSSGDKGCKILGFVDFPPSRQSQARLSGKIHKGDRIVSIDGIIVLSKRYSDIVAMLRKSFSGDTRTVTFRCDPDAPSRSTKKNIQDAPKTEYRSKTMESLTSAIVTEPRSTKNIQQNKKKEKVISLDKWLNKRCNRYSKFLFEEPQYYSGEQESRDDDATATAKSGSTTSNRIHAKQNKNRTKKNAVVANIKKANKSSPCQNLAKVLEKYNTNRKATDGNSIISTWTIDQTSLQHSRYHVHSDLYSRYHMDEISTTTHKKDIDQETRVSACLIVSSSSSCADTHNTRNSRNTADIEVVAMFLPQMDNYQVESLFENMFYSNNKKTNDTI